MLGNMVYLVFLSLLDVNIFFYILGHYTFSRLLIQCDYYGQLGIILYCYIRDWTSKTDQ